jgi:IS5 family transposase
VNSKWHFCCYPDTLDHPQEPCRCDRRASLSDEHVGACSLGRSQGPQKDKDARWTKSTGRAARDRPLSERQKSANTTRSKVRARVEHVFGQQQSSMGGKIVRTIGIARARFKIGMMNLGYNIRRLVQLERMAPAPA